MESYFCNFIWECISIIPIVFGQYEGVLGIQIIFRSRSKKQQQNIISEILINNKSYLRSSSDLIRFARRHQLVYNSSQSSMSTHHDLESTL